LQTEAAKVRFFAETGASGQYPKVGIFPCAFDRRRDAIYHYSIPDFDAGTPKKFSLPFEPEFVAEERRDECLSVRIMVFDRV
jgi:hypothetical protein